MKVVDVIVVRDRDVAAVEAVLMLVALVRRVFALAALVHVVLVHAVDVAVVCVVDVVIVLEGHVTASLAVNV
ncbi:hypothetical protein AB0L25_40965 [Spirillospora sp. NPDC052242]